MPDLPKEETLDPENWPEFRARAHAMLDQSIDQMQRASEGRVWRPVPEDLKRRFDVPLPVGTTKAVDDTMAALLPYGVGNTHPRFFGWVHGSGTPSNLLADMVAAAMNANLGGRDHGAIYAEKQVNKWVNEIFGFPDDASGLVVSGTSIATIIALKAARDQALDYRSRTDGVDQCKLVGYTSEQTHSCVARAFDILGLGSNALRKIPVNDAFQMDMDALRAAIKSDHDAGLTPFAIIGTAGAVNVGAVDDLAALADLSNAQNMWLHIDGAFGATAVLSERTRDRLNGIERADSIAFDFHKWLHVNYDAGYVLIRSEEAHRRAFSERPDYLKGSERGLASGNPWPTEYGPELSRGFRALKIWAQLAEHGTAKLGRLIEQNCAQARHLTALVQREDMLELLAPTALNICCFRLSRPGLALDRLNEDIVIELQMRGIAAPSTTQIHGKTAIRVNITNHRTKLPDLDLLVQSILEISEELISSGAYTQS